MDHETGSILFQKEADTLMPPASMSKLMTLEVVFKALKERRIKLEDEILVSTHAWKTGGAPSGSAAMFVPINTREPLSQILRGIIVQSGNDAAIAVAEALGKTEGAFAKIMTDRARALGLRKSTFGNPTGLPHPEQLMTARELALLARHLVETYPEFYPLFAEKEFQYRKHKFFNRNPLVGSDGYDGLKTGHTKEAGFGMVASAIRDGRRLIAVVSGLQSAEERKTEVTRLVNWGFSNFSPAKIYEAGEVVSRARVWGGSSFYVPLVGKGDVTMLLPKTVNRARLEASVVYSGPLKPPVRKGDAVAMLRVAGPGGTQSQVPLYAGEDVAPASFWRRGVDSALHLAFRWVPF
jgi:D-alanyl-D-alanine carboxypeptidase (penicillin-binding protein 5/6)